MLDQLPTLDALPPLVGDLGDHRTKLHQPQKVDVGVLRLVRPRHDIVEEERLGELGQGAVRRQRPLGRPGRWEVGAVEKRSERNGERQLGDTHVSSDMA